MTFLGPILFAALIILPGWLATLEDSETLEIAVVEYNAQSRPVPADQQFFRDVIPDKSNMRFIYLDNANLADILKAFDVAQYDGVLFLPQTLISAGKNATVEFYYRKPPGVGLESHISSSIEKFLFDNKLIVKQIPADLVESLETNVSLSRINWKNWPNKEEDITDVKRGLGYVAGFMIYIFIFMFGAQVMRGVLEEKTSRVIEVIISSVTPFELMMGKIIGIALIGLTQFVAWMILTIGITTFTQQVFLTPGSKAVTEMAAPSDLMESMPQTPVTESAGSNNNETVLMVSSILNQLGQINIPLVIGAFLFYFLGGYLLYGSLFAAIGAAVDNETDTQQFMLPITIPLIIGLFVMINSFLNPSGKLAVWFSLIPLTSPIVMMARIPFGVPPEQLLASVALLVMTFMGTVWLAARIYRTGILMYGKKASYGELWKWIRY
jgi:ABC-2 type transport system permease protein